MGRWIVHGERSLYESDWMNLRLVDVELPSGARFEHHVVRMPAEAAGVVVHDPDRGVLLIHRHRFATDTWGWEIPAGRIDPGESAAEAAAREVLEETGWHPGALRPLLRWHPASGSIDLTFNVFLADGATPVGPPSDTDEADRVAWVPLDEVRELLRSGQFVDGMGLTALAYFLSVDERS